MDTEYAKKMYQGKQRQDRIKLPLYARITQGF